MEIILKVYFKKHFLKSASKPLRVKNNFVKLKQQGVPNGNFAQSKTTLQLANVKEARQIGVIMNNIYEADDESDE